MEKGQKNQEKHTKKVKKPNKYVKNHGKRTEEPRKYILKIEKSQISM